jgi:hypothetical protein
MITNNNNELIENKKRYITLDEGKDFRFVSSIMSSLGFKMNHATARNVFMAAMKDFIAKISEEIGQELLEANMEEILKNQDVHEAFTDIIFKASEGLYTKEWKEEIKNEI